MKASCTRTDAMDYQENNGFVRFIDESGEDVELPRGLMTGRKGYDPLLDEDDEDNFREGV